MATLSVPSIDIHLKSPTQGLIVGLATGFFLGASSAFLWYSTSGSRPRAGRGGPATQLKGKLPQRADASDQTLLTPRSISTESSFDAQTDLKMVLLVRSDLKMGRGKACVQCGHAVHKQYKRLRKTRDPSLSAWEGATAPKVCLRVENEAELLNLLEDAKRKGVPTTVVVDSGRTTQVAPGTRTVAALGPGDPAVIHELTSNLALY
eukprot:jgi/Botrbrau1/7429/Bobra.0083s0002.1